MHPTESPKLNRLNKSLVYLCGPMEKLPDYGVDWRVEVTHALKEFNCGILNPADKPTDYINEDQKFFQSLAALKEKIRANPKDTAARKELADKMKQIVRIDLRMVDIAHFLFMYIDPDIHMCGSYSEQTMACLQRKPIIVYCPKGIYRLPGWIWGICDEELFFQNLDEVKAYLRYIDGDPNIDDLGKWKFFHSEQIFK